MAILDDHRLFREGLRRVMEGDPSLAVVGDGDPATVRDLIHTASPDVLLADGRAEGVLALAARFEVSQAEQARLAQRLSPREQEIVQAAVGGLSTQEIAVRLAICQSTVKAHLTHIFQKLGVRDRVQLMALHHRTPQPAGRR